MNIGTILELYDALVTKEGDWWVVLDRTSGYRYTFSLKTQPKPLIYDHPVLVDLKITNKCYKGCAFCYEGSTARGAHADPEKVFSILDALARDGVLEVVFGGGEPTLHPDLYRFIDKAQELGMATGFSTGDPGFVRRIGLPYRTAIGLSIRNLKEAKEFYTALDGHTFNTRLHLIPELLTFEELKSILKYARNKWNEILMLGLKPLPDCTKIDPVTPIEDDLKILLHSGFTVAVDTEVAKRVDLSGYNIPSQVYERWEGVSSCAIDAIEYEIAESSFSPLWYPFDPTTWTRRFWSFRNA